MLLTLITIVASFLSTPASALPQPAGAAFSCRDLQQAVQKLAVHTENVANRNATHTPAGGPYRRLELKCTDAYCEQIRREEFKLVYDPKHPDSNASGYVRYPTIDLGTESAAVNSAASEIKLLAGQELCGAKALSTGNMSLIKYAADYAIQSDTLNFSNEGRLTSWSRVMRDGTAQHRSFNPDGSLITATP